MNVSYSMGKINKDFKTLDLTCGFLMSVLSVRHCGNEGDVLEPLTTSFQTQEAEASVTALN